MSFFSKLKKKITLKSTLKVVGIAAATVATAGVGGAAIAAGVAGVGALTKSKVAPLAATGGGAVTPQPSTLGGVLRELGGAVVHAGVDLAKAETSRVTRSVQDALNAAKKDARDLASTITTGGAVATNRVDNVPTATPAGLAPTNALALAVLAIGALLIFKGKK